MKKRGCIYFDNSLKGVIHGRVVRHKEYCAEIMINGKRYRKRSVDRAVCERFIESMKTKYGVE